MIRKVEHAAIIVGDMDESIEFYRDLFGFESRVRGTTPTRELSLSTTRNRLIRLLETNFDHGCRCGSDYARNSDGVQGHQTDGVWRGQHACQLYIFERPLLSSQSSLCFQSESSGFGV